MNDFSKIQKSWQKIGAPNYKLDTGSETLFLELVKLKKKIVRANITMSILFAFNFIVFGWLWSHFPIGSRNPEFHIGLGLVTVLIAVTLFVMWFRVLFWNTPAFMTANTLQFLQKMIRKLRYYKWITNFYMPVYLVLLGIALAIYFNDVFANASLLFKSIGYGLSFSWVIGMGFYSWVKKRRKNQQEIDPILEQLKQVESSLKQQG